jgi:predicted dehydrogenase
MIDQPKLRWGILGCARIARRGLIPGIRASSSGILHSLASRSLATARAWADEFGVPRACGSYQEVLDDPQTSAVYIPLPNELHAAWVQAAADAGKHVLCEKPLALDAREADLVVEHCRRRGVLLMEAFMWRHQPRTLELRSMVRAGVIGELRLIRSSFSFPITPGDWRLDRSRGGGALWDVGCYGLNTARLFVGCEPVRSHALAHFGPSRVDLTLTGVAEFPNEVLASIDCSFEQPFRCSYELVGTRGMIEVPRAYLPPGDGRPSARVSTIGGGTGSGDPPVRIVEFESANQYAAMVDAFARSVAAGELVDPAEDGKAQMIALDQLRRSAETCAQ